MLTHREKQDIVEPIQKVIDHLVSRIEALEGKLKDVESPKAATKSTRGNTKEKA